MEIFQESKSNEEHEGRKNIEDRVGELNMSDHPAPKQEERLIGTATLPKITVVKPYPSTIN